jgi:hypothetical protein
LAERSLEQATLLRICFDFLWCGIWRGKASEEGAAVLPSRQNRFERAVTSGLEHTWSGAHPKLGSVARPHALDQAFQIDTQRLAGAVSTGVGAAFRCGDTSVKLVQPASTRADEGK